MKEEGVEKVKKISMSRRGLWMTPKGIPLAKENSMYVRIVVLFLKKWRSKKIFWRILHKASGKKQ